MEQKVEIGNNELIIQDRINVLASTDIIEYFKRKSIPLVIYRFRALANQGISNLHELLNEYKYPRSDNLRNCAQEILSFFPTDWLNSINEASEINSDVDYSETYFVNRWQPVKHRLVTVKGLKEIMLQKNAAVAHPYTNYEKFELPNVENHTANPFVLARNALHAPRDKFHKYRILQGDIFCNSRMYRFKMVSSPNCNTCPNEVESIKHLLWDCPRSARAWEYLNSQVRGFLGQDYVTYNSVVLGNSPPNMAMETMITWVTKMIMGINRENQISNEEIDGRFKLLFLYEKQTFGITSKRMKARWGPLLQKFNFNHLN